MFHKHNDDPHAHTSAVQERGRKKRTRPKSSLTPTPSHRSAHNITPEPADTAPPEVAEGQAAGLAKLPTKSIIGIVIVVILLSMAANWLEKHRPKPPAPPDEVSDSEADLLPEISRHDFNDWTTTVDGRSIGAHKTRAYNYDDCDGIELGEALTELGCRTAMEAQYRADDEHIELDLTVIVTSNPENATGLAANAHADDFALEHNKSSDDDGYLQWRIDATETFVVAVRCKADEDVPDTVARQYQREFFNDHLAKVAEM